MRTSRFGYFFFGTPGMVEIRAGDDPTAGPTRAVWELTSSDEAELPALTARLKHDGILP